MSRRVIPYHGGPITPETCAYRTWRARHAFVSFANPRQIELAASVCQSFALDNGAYSAWRAGRPIEDWQPYYAWCAEWLPQPACDWAVIPDVIGGTEADNDALVDEWPHGPRGVPVWHLDESVARLVRLAAGWPRVALGSTAAYDVRRPDRCVARLADALRPICVEGVPTCKLHGLRMLHPEIVSRVPLSSADSTNVARNIRFDQRWTGRYAPATRETRVDILVERVELVAPARRLTVDAQLVMFPAPPDDDAADGGF